MFFSGSRRDVLLSVIASLYYPPTFNSRNPCFLPPVVVALAPSHFVIRLGLVCLVCLGE